MDLATVEHDDHMCVYAEFPLRHHLRSGVWYEVNETRRRTDRITGVLKLDGYRRIDNTFNDANGQPQFIVHFPEGSYTVSPRSCPRLPAFSGSLCSGRGNIDPATFPVTGDLTLDQCRSSATNYFTDLHPSAAFLNDAGDCKVLVNSHPGANDNVVTNLDYFRFVGVLNMSREERMIGWNNYGRFNHVTYFMEGYDLGCPQLPNSEE